jgi:hypothetical protein
MRRHVTRYIDHLHTKPEDERIQYALWGAGIVTGLIFFVWIMFFFAKLNTPTIVTVPADLPQTAQEQVDKILEEAKYGVPAADPAPSEISSPSSTDDWSADLYKNSGEVQ